jgi:hypothetical protein
LTAGAKTADGLKISAGLLLNLLAVRHSKDVFVPECKDGPTWGGGVEHVRLDAWAMPRSWVKPATTGYEIKVSRSDFLGDDKWQAYLPLCHKFYFVAPPGIIKPDEVSAEAGLIVTTRNATRLLTKKKAPLRDIQIPEELWRYVLMCRAKITNDRYVGATGVDRWREWLAEKDENKQIGYNVSRNLQRLVEERIEKVESDNRTLEFKIKEVEGIRKILEEMGITNLGHWRTREEVAERLRAQTAEGIDKEFLDQLTKFAGEASRIAKTCSETRELLAGQAEEPAT